jgi:hypothetical protein
METKLGTVLSTQGGQAEVPTMLTIPSYTQTMRSGLLVPYEMEK